MYNIILMISFALMSNVNAQNKGGPPEGISAGVAAIYVSSLYKGQEYRFRPIPSFSINYGRFSMFGPRLAYRIAGEQGNSVSLIALPNFFGGYEAEDSPYLRGMETRKGTASLGLSFNYRIKYITFQGSYTKDVLGIHGGSSASLSVRSGIPINIFIKSLPFTFLGVGFGANYNSESFINYYYGVKYNEVTSGRLGYVSSGALNPFINFTMRTQISADWMFMTTYNSEYLSSKIKNSPIVNKDSVYRIFSNLSYSF
jgi:outer membrane protein